MITRKLGKILCGNATPFQVLAACVLSSWLAFVPGFAQGPGWILTLVAALLVLNANLGLAVLVAAPVRLASLALVPLTFEVGRFLLDGPTSGLFRALVNAPVLAWFGLEHYVTTGGMVLGLVFGLGSGLAVNRMLATFRRKLSGLEQGSERYQELVKQRWVRVLRFVFVGKGRGKESYEELLQRRVGNPVRVAGVVLVAVVLAGAFFARRLLAEPIVTHAVRVELESANGATVELGSVELDLQGGRLTVRDLALVDPDDLHTDLFRAGVLEADLDLSHLLRRRITLERVVVRDAVHGAPRAQPGRRIGPGRGSDAPEEVTPREDEKTLEDYLQDAERWSGRLARARRILERMSSGESSEEAREEASEDLRDRLARRVREQGYVRVDSERALTDVPTLTVAELVIDGLASHALADEVLDLRASNLSTHPHLLAEAPQLSVRSRSGRYALGIGVTPDGSKPQGNALHLHAKELPVDRLASSLVAGGRPLLAGGTLEVHLDGSWAGGRPGFVDLPLRVTLRQSTLHLPGQPAAEVDELLLPIGLRGPIDAPRIRIDPDELREALVKAGAKRLASELESKADELLDEHAGELGEALGEQATKSLGEDAKQRLGSLLGGGK